MKENRTWTEEQKRVLSELWSEGRTGTEIANILAESHGMKGLTRNAIMGKVHRLKLKREMALKTMESKPRLVASEGRKVVLKAEPAKTEKVAFAREEFDDPLQRRRLRRRKIGLFEIFDLDNGRCKWPTGEDSRFMTYCGAKCSAVYCSHHLEISRVPMRRVNSYPWRKR